jgi:DNA-directed RNA polymerase specialized sigma54-like protein
MILEDIAKIVGKDISTVSRILENRTYIIENETFYYNDLLNQHDFSTFDGRPVS